MRSPTWAVLLLLPGCGGAFEYTPAKYPDTRWNVSAVEVSIVDQREGVNVIPPRVPEVTFPGSGRGAELKLPPTFRKFVQYRLAQLVSRAGPQVRLEIAVESARAEWSASALSETERATATLRFRVLSADGRLLSDGVGHGSREHSSMDASDDELAAVFRAACNDAFDNFLGNEKNISLLNSRR